MRRQRRGYILLEVAVGGAMIAIAILGLMSSLADGRTRNVVGGRDVIAAQLALDKIEMQRARGFGDTGTNCALSELIHTQGVYTRNCTMASGPAYQRTMFGVTVNYEQVTVEVSYETSLGTRKVTLVSEVYQ